ncbi:MAG: hypothetical protein M1820_000057 [Bogoriella megaspora]|nr:MAG: hypothetical protein M1820_000057 [Bogoriella megaspora]
MEGQLVKGWGLGPSAMIEFLIEEMVKKAKRDAQMLRLGTSDLGPYAFENMMPWPLYRKVEAGPRVVTKNEVSPRDGSLIQVRSVEDELPGMLEILATLVERDDSVDHAYFCHPGVQHVGRLPHEQHFCGYKAIQMLISYIIAAKIPGHEQFAGRIPGILQLQGLIERAWNHGFGTIAGYETGGIQGTRKWIGSAETSGFLRSLGMGISKITSLKDDLVWTAWDRLVFLVESYFRQGVTGPYKKTQKTLLPPLHLVRRGHVMVVIGLEILASGPRSLLIFDPGYILAEKLSISPASLLKMYRRGRRELGSYKEFAVIALRDCAPPPCKDPWTDVGQAPFLPP